MVVKVLTSSDFELLTLYQVVVLLTTVLSIMWILGNLVHYELWRMMDAHHNPYSSDDSEDEDGRGFHYGFYREDDSDFEDDEMPNHRDPCLY